MPNYANNLTSLKYQFDQKLLYQIQHPYLYDKEYPIPISFWSLNNGFYGRRDLARDMIYPDASKMKQIDTANANAVYVLPFVVDAFEDFVKYMKIQKSNKLLADDNFTRDWTAKRGWFDIEQIRKQVVENLMDSFVGSFLTTSNKHKEVKNFDSFLYIFINEYLNDMVYDVPITKSGLINSNYYSPMCSGLCVEISYADHGDDQLKFDKFISNPNFKLYSLAASKYGFLVDLNAPWRLVANLNSENMKKYISQYMYYTFRNGDTTPSINSHYHTYSIDENGNGETTSIIQGAVPVADHSHNIVEKVISPNAADIVNHKHIVKANPDADFSPQNVYDNFYISAILEDLGSLRQDIIIAYTNYIIDYPSPTVPEICGKGGTPRVILKSIKRPPAVVSKIDEKYPPVFWLKLLFQIRLKEMKADIDDVSLKYNLKKIDIINKTVDFSSALLYAQKYLKQYY